MSHFEELLAKYNKTTEDITFEYEGMSDEELDAKFTELFGDIDIVIDEADTEGTSADESNSEPEVTETVTEELEQLDTDDSEVVEPETVEPEVFARTYELSHDDIRCALYNLLVPYEEADGDYYYISEVFDSYFVYESWCGERVFGQAYVKDEETVAFDGERYELFKELLTASEKAELEAMRSNYSQLYEKVKGYEKVELEAKKTDLLNSEDYDLIRDDEEFTKLVKDHEDISFEELEGMCDKIILKAAKSGKYGVATSEEQHNTTTKKQFTNPEVNKKKPSRYGNLFKK